MENTNRSRVFKAVKALAVKIAPRRISHRVAFITSILIVITLGLFVFVNMPYQRSAILKAMESEAKSTVTSIGQVTASSIISEDFAAVVDHCMKVVKESPSISYVVVTRNDGFSLIFSKRGWTQNTLNGIWVPEGRRVDSSRFLKSDIAPEEVFHFSTPFQYSSIDWGWIHIGLSLKRFNSDIASMYYRTTIIVMICLILGVVVALFTASRLTRPISILDGGTKQVAGGNLSVRLDIHSGDELEDLAISFNAMTSRLQESLIEITNSREYTENIIKSMNDAMFVLSSKGVIEQVNSAAIRLLGFDEEELLGSDISNYFSITEQKSGDFGSDQLIAEALSYCHLSGREALLRSKNSQSLFQI